MVKLARSATALWLALSTVGAAAQPVTPDQLMQHIRVLADDGYDGRASGTAGGQRTEAYILEAFARAGLEPGADGGWRQVVSVVRRTPDTTRLSFAHSGKPVALAEDAVILTGSNPTTEFKDAAVIFAGYATEAELAGAPVKDAVLMMIPAQPPSWNGALSWQDRRKALFEAGAAAVITIQPAGQAWNPAAERSRTSVNPSDEKFPRAQGSMAREAALSALGTAGDGKALLAAADRPGFKARRLPLTVSGRIDTYIEQVDPANIVGMVKGTGNRQEAVVLIGHWDHTGLCRPEGAPDRICNGAVDNASGIAVMIEVARAIAAGPRPERDIYFVATALEEEGGFLGASAFANDGPPWIDRYVAVLNVDSIAIHPRGLPVAIIGRGRFPSLDSVIDSTARSLGRRIDLDGEANVMIERQDGWAFTRLGIPSVMASGSFSDMKILQGYLASSYHQPNDDATRTIELGGAAEDADLHIALLRALADPKIYPTPAPPPR